MNFFSCFAIAGHAVVRATLWLVNGIRSLGRLIGNMVCGAVRSTTNVLRAAWRHPFVTATVIAALVVAWLYLGWTPLLSALGVLALLGIAVRLGIALYRWLAAGSTAAPVPPQKNPQRNGRPVNPSVNSTVAGAV